MRVCAAYSQWSSVSREHPPRLLTRQTSPAAAVTSPRMSINYKKKRILCGLCWISGLFLRVLLVIFRNRKTPRFDACQKIAVRSWLNRNGVLNLELFNFAPDKTSRWQIVHRPGLAPGRVRLPCGREQIRTPALAASNFQRGIYCYWRGRKIILFVKCAETVESAVYN